MSNLTGCVILKLSDLTRSGGLISSTFAWKKVYVSVCDYRLVQPLYRDYVLSSTLDKGFVLECLGRALSHRRPEIINSDQGSHLTNADYINLLKDNSIKISMDGKGQCLNNARIERFFRTLKYDCIYINEYSTPRELRVMLKEYMASYNTYRPHSSLDGACPTVFYSSKLKAAA